MAFRSFHFKNWIDNFEKNLAGSTVKSAFEKTEEEFKKQAGEKYYSSFESFKSSRTNRKKSKRRKPRD